MLGFKQYIEEDWFTKLLNKYLLKPKTYKMAAELLQKVLDRKRKEGSRKTKEYYAQRIAQNFKGVDARELAGMVAEEYGAGEKGTDKLTKKYKKDTPGERVDEDDDKDPCWDGYKQVGMKKGKGGKQVPNCVPEQTELEEAEYEGRKVKLNDPFRSDDNKHKFYVYVKNEKGNVIKLGFGDPNMDIKRDDPGRRKNFRARHQCDTNPGPKWKARYWSCKMWEKGKSVSDVLGD